MYARPRLALSLGSGLLVGIVAAVALPSERELALMLGWSGVCAAFVLSVWVTIRNADAAETRRLAEREDDGRATARSLLTAGALVSLVAVGGGLIRSHQMAQQKNPMEAGIVLTTLATVSLTWLLVHTESMLHYARLYYDGEDGGVDFGSEDEPCYSDFAYLAFTVGMTFQVSDTQIKDRKIRRAVLHHAVLSYLFGTILVAITINGVASLAG